MPNVQVGGQALIVEGMADATAKAGGIALIVEGMADATAQIGGVVLLVEAIPQTASGVIPIYHYRRRRT